MGRSANDEALLKLSLLAKSTQLFVLHNIGHILIP